MSCELHPLTADHQTFPWSHVLLSICGAVGLVFTISFAVNSQTSSSSHLLLSTQTSRVTVAPAMQTSGLLRQAPSARGAAMQAPPSDALRAQATNQMDAADAPEPPSLAAVWSVAAASTLFGAVAMQLWSRRRSAVAPLNAVAIGSPTAFRPSAPWTSSVTMGAGHLPAGPEDRSGRLVLHAAAKDKGKPGAKPAAGGKGGGKGKVVGIIKLALPAGKATPAPPVGPALGQYGLNIVAFCKEYNALTEKDAADAMIIPVEITAFDDRTFTFILKTPPASVLLRKAAGVPKGSANPKKEIVGSVTRSQLEEIARTKLPDLNTTVLESAMRTIEGTAKNMGIAIKD